MLVRDVAISTDQAAPLGEEEQPASSAGTTPAHCAVARCAEIVCGKWTLLVVRDLADGPRSYSELQESLNGISPRTLCDRLDLLVRERLVTRTRIKALPPRTIYELTQEGHALVPIVETMRSVGEQLLARPPLDAVDVIGDDCCGG